MTDFLAIIATRSETIPDDVTAEGAVHALIEMLETSDNLTEMQAATIVGAAAMLYRQAFQEFQAGLQTSILFSKLNR